MKLEGTPYVRVYHANPWVRACVYGVAFCLAAAAVWFFLATRRPDGKVESAALIPGGLLLLLAGRCYLAMARVRLELTPEGIRLRTFGDTLETSWSNVVGVHLAPMQQGFITRDPLDGKRMRIRATQARNYLEEIRVPMRERRFIPLSPFAWNLRHGDFVSLTQRFCPEIRLPVALAAPGTRATVKERLLIAVPFVFLAALVATPLVIGLTATSTPGTRRFSHRILGGFYAASIGFAVLEAARRGYRQGARGKAVVLGLSAIVVFLIALLVFIVAFAGD